MTTYKLWDNVPGLHKEQPVLEYYPAQNKKTDACFVIMPGGGYAMRAEHEGKGYAEMLNDMGVSAFVCQYRVSPHRFPLPLLDARRAIRFVRSKASEFGIDPEKIAIMGSSAGGHLAALASTYREMIDFEGEDELDCEAFLPDATVLCYPVIWEVDESEITHDGSYRNLLGDRFDELNAAVNPAKLVCDTTPPAFLWHTSDDAAVNVCNSFRYGEALRKQGIPFEMHVFPCGPHGLGVAKDRENIHQWVHLLEMWLKTMNWL